MKSITKILTLISILTLIFLLSSFNIKAQEETTPEPQTKIRVTGDCKCTAVDPPLQLTVSGTGESESEAKDEAEANCYDRCYMSTSWSNAEFTPTETTTVEEGAGPEGAGPEGEGEKGEKGTGIWGQGVERPTFQNPLQFQTGSELLSGFLTFLIGGLGLFAVGAIIIGGFMYMTSAGSEEKIKLARSILTYAVIGLVVSILAYIIVNTVIRVIGG